MLSRQWAAISALALITLCSCSPASIPTQADPTCSWAVTPPQNAQHLCTVSFATVRALATADIQGDNQTVRRIVRSPAIANHIIAYGRHIRSLGASNFHAVPSVTLDITPRGLVGLTSFLTGSIKGGHIREPFTLYMRISGNTARVLQHDPGLAW